MFFIMGISQGEKQLDYNKTVICDECGRYGRLEVFMTYMYFSFFFIPLFKWSRRYYVRMSCCQSVYELDPEVGRAIAEGQNVTIRQEDMVLVSRNTGRAAYYERARSFYDENAYNDAYDQGAWGRTGNGRSTGNIHDAAAASKQAADSRNAGSNAADEYEPYQKMLPGTSEIKTCSSCGYVAPVDFEYCPKCGRKL